MILVFPYDVATFAAIAQTLGNDLTPYNQRYVSKSDGLQYFAVEVGKGVGDRFTPSPLEFDAASDFLIWLNDASPNYTPDPGFVFSLPPGAFDFAPEPSPAEFLKYCFSGEDAELRRIFNETFAVTFTNQVAAVWYQQMVHGSSDTLFVLGDPPQSTGWGLALSQLAIAVNLSGGDRAIINGVLPRFGLPALL